MYGALALFCAVGLCAFVQILTARHLAQALVSVFVAILWGIALAFYLDLDLLASLMAAVYSSVFLFLTLFSLHLSTYWSSPALEPRPLLNASVSLVWAFSAFLLAPAWVQSSDKLNLLWADVTGALQDTSALSADLIHSFFYEVFVCETVSLNVYILLGLVTAVTVFSAFKAKAVRPQKTPNPKVFPKELGAAKATNDKVRAVSSFRRQVRRKNNTNTRTVL